MTASTRRLHTTVSLSLCRSLVKARSAEYARVAPMSPMSRSRACICGQGVRDCCQAYSKHLAAVSLANPDTTHTYSHGRCFCVGLAPPLLNPLWRGRRATISTVKPMYERCGEDWLRSK